MTLSMFRQSRLLAWTFALFLMLIAGAAIATEADTQGEEATTSEATTEKATTEEATPEAAPAPASALRVTIDPETGKMVVPPPAERRKMALTPEMQNAFSQSDENLPTVVMPDGTVRVDLQGRFRNLLFATVDENGQAKVDHALPEHVEVIEEEVAESEANHE